MIPRSSRQKNSPGSRTRADQGIVSSTPVKLQGRTAALRSQTQRPSIPPDTRSAGTQLVHFLAGQRHCCVQCYSSCSPCDRRRPTWFELRCLLLLADATTWSSGGEHQDVYAPLFAGLGAGSRRHRTARSTRQVALGRVGVYRVSGPKVVTGSESGEKS